MFKNSKTIKESGLFTEEVKVMSRIQTKETVYFITEEFCKYNKVISLELKIKDQKLKLQFILVNEDPFNFINKSFDFNFCKIAFTGDTIKSNYFNEINNYSGNISDDYIKSCLDINTPLARYRICKTLERIEKYMKRGYRINNYKEFLDVILTYMKDIS